MTIGGLERRKNYERAIDAFTRSRLPERGYSYVISGPRGNSAAEIEKIASATPAVRLCGYVDDAELRWLYRNASGFVLPSLLEGFGLPALEAAQHRLLTLVSADSALEEAIGGNAVLVDPLSVDSIAAGMRRLIEMPTEQRMALLDAAVAGTRPCGVSAPLVGSAVETRLIVSGRADPFRSAPTPGRNRSPRGR